MRSIIWNHPAAPDCPATQSAVWARPGVVFDPATQKIYFATGNGTYDPTRHDWGDSVLALNPDGTGANGGPFDSFTPADFQVLDQTDADLGSTSPVILPERPEAIFLTWACKAAKTRFYA